MFFILSSNQQVCCTFTKTFIVTENDFVITMCTAAF